MSDHLTVTTTDRGFSHLPEILSSYPGGSVRVYESSAASHPSIWLTATAPVDLNEPEGPQVRAPIHLSVEDAWRLAEQLMLLVKHHYQGDYEPAGPVIRQRSRPIDALTDAEARGAQRMIDALRSEAYVSWWREGQRNERDGCIAADYLDFVAKGE